MMLIPLIFKRLLRSLNVHEDRQHVNGFELEIAHLFEIRRLHLWLKPHLTVQA